MKNQNRKLGKLKFNKNVISNFSSNGVIGGGTSNVYPSNCATCTSNNPDVACEKTDEPHNHQVPRGTIVEESSPAAGCYPISSPDEAC